MEAEKVFFEMSESELCEVNGGSLLVLACCAIAAIALSSCSNNRVEITIGHGSNNNIAVGDSIQNH